MPDLNAKLKNLRSLDYFLKLGSMKAESSVIVEITQRWKGYFYLPYTARRSL